MFKFFYIFFNFLEREKIKNNYVNFFSIFSLQKFSSILVTSTNARKFSLQEDFIFFSRAFFMNQTGLKRLSRVQCTHIRRPIKSPYRSNYIWAQHLCRSNRLLDKINPVTPVASKFGNSLSAIRRAFRWWTGANSSKKLTDLLSCFYTCAN